MTDLERTLWGRITSINVQKVVWVMGELDLACARIDAGGAYGGLDDAAYRAMNPNGRVPTLLDCGAVLWESNAICRYLVDAYDPDHRLKGRIPLDRAAADMWMEWFQSNVYANFIQLFYHTVRLPPSQRDPAVRDKALAAVEAQFAIFEKELSDRPFLLGDRPSLGDVPMGSCLYRYFTIDIPRTPMPSLESYYRRLQNRPAFRAGVMIDYDPLRGAD